MNVVNARGDGLVDLIAGPEEQLLADSKYRPLTHALVIARYRGSYLVMFNRHRRNWEVPGGTIDPGETPRSCAMCEFLEETGHDAAHLELASIMHFRTYPDAHDEFGALYATELDTIAEFLPNDEAEELRLWDLETEIGEVDTIDRALCHLLRSAAAQQ